MTIKQDNLAYMNNGYVDTYVVRKHDTLRSLMTSLYRMPPIKSNAELMIWAIYELNDISSLKLIKVGMNLKLPLLIFTNDGSYSFHNIEPIIDVRESNGRHESCNACLSNSDKLYNVMIGCNKSSVSSRLCRHCLSVLHLKIGGVLNDNK